MKLGVLVYAALSMLFGFPPTGAVAVVMALSACEPGSDAESGSDPIDRAVRWARASLIIGGVLEIPAVVALLAHSSIG